MFYDAAQRTKRIIVERDNAVDDGYGGQEEAWGVYCKPSAAVVYQTGQERREAAQTNGSVIATFFVLNTSKTRNISVKDRIRFDSGIWNITSNVPSREFNVGRDITAVRAVG